MASSFDPRAYGAGPGTAWDALARGASARSPDGVLQAALREARTALEQDRPQQALETLEHLDGEADRAAAGATRPPAFGAPVSAMRGTVAVLHGRALLLTGDESRGRARLRDGVALLGDTVPATGQELADRADALALLGDDAGAIAAYRQARERGERPVAMLARFARVLRRQADVDPEQRETLRADARDVAEEIVAIDPDGAEGWALLGDVLGDTGERDDAAEMLIQGGYSLAGSGDVAAARDLFAHALDYAPADTRARVGLAETLRVGGDLDAAAEHVLRVLRVDPDDAAALQIRGRIELDRGDVEAAVTTVRRATELDPDNPGIWTLYATVLLRADDPDGALEAAAHGEALAPGDPSVRWALAMAMLEQEDYAGAEVIIQDVVDAAPSDAAMWDLLGEVQRVQGKLDLALAAYDRSLGLDPANPEVMFDKGVALEFNGDLEPAVASYRAAIEHGLDDPRPRTRLAATLTQLGRHAEALEAADAALERDATDLLAQRTKAEALRRAGRSDAALEMLAEILEGTPGDGWTLATRGQILAAEGADDEAIAALRDGLAADPTLDWAAHELAAVLHRRAEAQRLAGELEDALALLDEADGLAPDNAWSLATRAQVVRARGDRAEAIRLLSRAVELDATMPWVWIELWHALREEGRSDEAVAGWRAALTRIADPAVRDALDSGVRTGLAAYLRQQAEELRLGNRYDDALSALDEADALEPDNAYSLATRAQMLRPRGARAEAVALLERAVELDPTMAWMWIELWYALREDGHGDRALARLHSTLETIEDPARRLKLESEVLASIPGQEGAALTVLTRLNEDYPPDRDTLLRLGRLLRGERRTEEAKQILEGALALDGGAIDVLQQLGYVAIDERKVGEARSIFKRAAALDPRSVAALTDLAWVDMNLGRLKKSEESVRRALDLEPENMAARYVHAQILLEAGRASEAVAVLEPLSAVAPDVADYLFALGLGHEWEAGSTPEGAVEHITEMRRCFVRASELDERDAWAQLRLGGACSYVRDDDAAERAFTAAIRLVQIAPDLQAEEFVLLGVCQSALGQHKDAIQSLLTSIARGFFRPLDDAKVQFDFGRILMVAGTANAGVDAFRRGIHHARDLERAARFGVLAGGVSDLNNALRTTQGATIREPAALVLKELEAALSDQPDR